MERVREMEDELTLVRRAQEGDQRAFEELVRAYESKVYAIVLRWTGNREDALDGAQEVFLRMFRFLSSFDCRSSFSTWIYRVAVNVCKDAAAKRARLQEQPLERDDGEGPYETELPDARYEPEALYARQERAEALQKALAALPEEHRAVILLRDLRGLSYREIGDVLDLEEGTVKSRIARAREKLRALLVESGNFFDAPQSNITKGGRTE